MISLAGTYAPKGMANGCMQNSSFVRKPRSSKTLEEKQRLGLDKEFITDKTGEHG